MRTSRTMCPKNLNIFSEQKSEHVGGFFLIKDFETALF